MSTNLFFTAEMETEQTKQLVMVFWSQQDQRVVTCTYIGNAWCHVSDKELNYCQPLKPNNYNALLLGVTQFSYENFNSVLT